MIVVVGLIVGLGLLALGVVVKWIWFFRMRRRSMREFEDPSRLDLFRRHPEWKKED